MKLLKKIFNKDVIKNQRGSTLSITIIVIAVLSFSITAITKTTVNLSGSTTAELVAVNNESKGKALITQSINEFETYITATDSYTDFNNVEIGRLLRDYGVVITDDTSKFPQFGDLNGKTTKVYKFSFNLANGDTLYKYAYMSNSGSAVDTYLPFEFSIATEGDLILNGGYYDDISMYGKNIYVSNVAPWEENELTYLGVTHYLSSGNAGTYPTFTYGGNSSKVFYTNEYQYCTSNCYSVTENGSNPYKINLSNYVDVEGGSLSDTGDVQDETIISFFNEFSYEDFAVNFAANILPTDNRKITDNLTLANFETVIRNNADPITYKTGKGKGGGKPKFPNTPYVDITGDNNYDFDSDGLQIDFGAVYDCAAAGVNELVIWDSFKLKNFEDEGLIVLGDLVINNSDNSNEVMSGTYIITGDLTFTGQRLDFRQATFIVFGETKIEMDYDYGIYTKGNQYELSIFSLDNIRYNDSWKNYGTSTPTTITALFYTEESIMINTVMSKLVIEGALFARANGNSNNPIFLENDSNQQMNGIMINSFRGYVSEYYETVNGTWTKSINYVNSNSVTANRFQMYPVPANQFTDIFLNIPVFEGVTIQNGVYTLETSEWKLIKTN